MARWRNTRGKVLANFDQSRTEYRSQDVDDLILVTIFEFRLLDFEFVSNIFCPQHSSPTSISSYLKVNLTKRKFLMKDGSFQNRQRCGQSNHIHRFISQLVLVSFKIRDECTRTGLVRFELCLESEFLWQEKLSDRTRASRKSWSLLKMRIQDTFKIYQLTF